MNITFLIIIAALAIIAAGATAIALLRERAPRIVADPERVARLRDRLAETESRLLHEQLEERIAEERHSRDSAPQRNRRLTTERLWAGGL